MPTDRTTRIDATATKFWFALLRDTNEGVETEIWKQLPIDGDPGAFMTKLEGKVVYDMPFHVVCDRVHALLNRLEPPFVIGGAKKPD